MAETKIACNLTSVLGQAWDCLSKRDFFSKWYQSKILSNELSSGQFCKFSSAKVEIAADKVSSKLLFCIKKNPAECSAEMKNSVVKVCFASDYKLKQRYEEPIKELSTFHVIDWDNSATKSSFSFSFPISVELYRLRGLAGLERIAPRSGELSFT
ncbi:hypothetical protein T02_2809 [Trichinella nativa]|uniref:Uncharacterized protein n=1 Tax=Trichinella nativa TaxID=6335 RepID=A0A0V1KRN5_9BILA|nr:hypothetical protein T02_2809 [Trichinella nativa]